MKKGRSVSSWVKAEVLCLLLFCALGILLMPDQVQAYGIEYGAVAQVDGHMRDASIFVEPNQRLGGTAAAVHTDWAHASAGVYVSLSNATMEVHYSGL